MPALQKAYRNGLVVSIVTAGFIALAIYSIPYQDKPAAPVVLSTKHEAVVYSEKASKAVGRLIARADAERLTAPLVADVFGNRLPTGEQLAEWSDVAGGRQ